MNKPMYKTVEDARKGKATGQRIPAKISTKSRKLIDMSAEEIELNESLARDRLMQMVVKIKKTKTPSKSS